MASGGILIFLLFLEIGRTDRLLDESTRVKSALHDSETRYRRALLDAPIPIMIHAEDGEVVMISRRWSELTGYSHDDLPTVGSWIERAYGASQQQLRRVISGLYDLEAAVSEGESLVTTSEGKQRVWDFYSGPLGRLPDGRRLVISMAVDVSERKHAEAALLAASDKATRASAAKSRFLAAVNHDLRQPMQALRLLLASLEGAQGEHERQEIHSEMASALEAMGGLLNHLLDIGDLEEGRIAFEISEFPVATLFRRMAGQFAPQAREKGLGLRIVDSSLVLRSDVMLLQRVIENLLSNALRYTDQGKILLGCRRRGSAARIEVWDSGIGIPDEALADIFEDHYQLDNPARDRGKGLGLGLAIVQRIGKLLGHRLDVRSAHGKGSMFAVEVPIGDSSSANLDGKIPAVHADDVLSGSTILLVEDDQTVLTAMRLLLQAWRARPIVGASADVALRQLEGLQVSPDVLFVDYHLAGGSTGLQAVQQINAALRSNLPAIIVTGDTAPGGDDFRTPETHQKPNHTQSLPNYPGQNIHLKARPTTPTLKSDRSLSNAALQKRLVRSPGQTVLTAMRLLLQAWRARPIVGASADVALRQLEGLQVSPDVLFVDYHLAGGSTGLQAVQQINAALRSNLPAIIVTGDTAPAITHEIEAAGHRVVYKPLDPVELRRLIVDALVPVTAPAARVAGH